MKKILIRAGVSPVGEYSTNEIINNNLIGNNVGNLLFPFSISRALMKPDVEINNLIFSKKVLEHQIDRINNEYDALIIPLANAFRRSNVRGLNIMTKCIRKIKIPCIVVGVGAQAPINGEIEDPILNKATEKFVKAVLKKSDSIGLRGEFTADYLQKLGFTPEKDFTVTGCPSMYLYGDTLPEMRLKELTAESKVSMNSKVQLPQKFHDFMERSAKLLPNHHYVPQVIEEIRMMYNALPFPDGFTKTIPTIFPASYDASVYQQGKGITFVNVPSWLNYLKEKDFSFGSRIHGNIAAILAGTPCFIVVSDARIKELVDYHHIPHIMMDDLTSSTNIMDLYEKADYSAIKKGHKANFDHYLDFLHKNGLDTIYDNGSVEGKTPFDKKVESLKLASRVEPYVSVSKLEQMNRKMKQSSLIMSYYKGKQRKGTVK